MQQGGTQPDQASVVRPNRTSSFSRPGYTRDRSVCELQAGRRLVRRGQVRIEEKDAPALFIYVWLKHISEIVSLTQTHIHTLSLSSSSSRGIELGRRDRKRRVVFRMRIRHHITIQLWRIVGLIRRRDFFLPGSSEDWEAHSEKALGSWAR